MKQLINVALVTLISIAGWFFGSVMGNKRILGGRVVKIEEYPFFVSLRGCGGSIIDSKWVLTAGHCVSNGPQHSVGVGVSSKRVPPENLRYATHNAFYPDEKNGDIALIRLNESLQFNSKVQPVALPKPNEDQFVHEAEALGMGSTGPTMEPGEEMLLKAAKHEDIDTPECWEGLKKYYGPSIGEQSPKYWNEYRANFVCVIKRKGEGTCSGDSGGPLVAKRNGTFVLIGVVAKASKVNNITCSASVDSYALFTRVSRFIDWITFLTGLN